MAESPSVSAASCPGSPSWATRAPVVNALKRLSLQPGGQQPALGRLVVLIGAMLGMISSILVFQLGQARVWFAMSRDGLLPTVFSSIHPRFRTPAFATWVAGFVVGIPAGLLDIGTVSNLSNIGTLFAFVLVSIARAHPALSRARAPSRLPRSLGPVFPVLSIIFCIVLMMGLEVMTWDGVLHLARHRPADLLLLQPPPQRVRSSTLRNDRSQRTRSVIGP